MKYEIDFFTERIPWKWHPDELESFLPGTMEWLLQDALALQDRGNQVSIFWDGGDFTWKGIRFRNRKFYDGSSQIAIAWNHANAIPKKTSAKILALWTHAANPEIDLETYERLDFVFALSELHAYRVKEHVLRLASDPASIAPGSIDLSKILPLYPGLDLEEFSLNEAVERDPHLAIYASSWDRGLDRLIGFWPALRRINPKLKLKVCYSRAWMKRLGAPWRHIPEEWKDYGIEVVSPSRKEMGKLYREANFLLYPCTGGEMFCLSAWKAQFMDCIPITTDMEALSETNIRGCVVPISAWLETTKTIISHPHLWQKLRQEKKDPSLFVSWDVSASRMERIFDGVFVPSLGEIPSGL